MSYGPNPWVQQHWDRRAAANFIGGGAGSGLVLAAALTGAPPLAYALGALGIGLGLIAVAFEIGRPLRSLNVYRHAQTSWMTREAMVAPLLLIATGAAGLELPFARVAAGLLALAYGLAQARILRKAKGIPAWRSPRLQPLVVATGIAEGSGVLLLIGWTQSWVWGLLALALAVRWAAWSAWRGTVKGPAQRPIGEVARWFVPATLIPLATAIAVLLTPLPPVWVTVLAVVAGAATIAAGWVFKHALITRCAFNQGFALPHLPVRGVRRP